jgi:hypothetical protein
MLRGFITWLNALLAVYIIFGLTLLCCRSCLIISFMSNIVQLSAVARFSIASTRLCTAELSVVPLPIIFIFPDFP